METIFGKHLLDMNFGVGGAYLLCPTVCDLYIHILTFLIYLFIAIEQVRFIFR